MIRLPDGSVSDSGSDLLLNVRGTIEHLVLLAEQIRCLGPLLILRRPMPTRAYESATTTCIWEAK